MATLTSQCLAFVNQFSSNKSVKFTFLEFHSLLANPITELESLLKQKRKTNNQGRRACVEEASLSATEAKRRQHRRTGAAAACLGAFLQGFVIVLKIAPKRPGKASNGL